MIKQMAQKLLLVAALIAFGTFAQAQGGQAMSLTDCIQFALENHPDIKTAQLQVKDADWRVKENLSTGLPQISAGATYSGFIQRGGLPSSALGFGSSGPVDLTSALPSFNQDQVTDLNGVFGNLFASDPDSKVFFNPVHSVSGNVSLNQLIFNNSYLIGLRAAKYYRQYVDNQLAVTRQTIRNRVTDAYLPALLISDNLSILDKNIGNLEKLFSDTKAINQAGFAEQLDVDRLELSLSNLRSERGSLARQREIVVNALKFNMGMPIANEISLSDNTGLLLAAVGEIDMTSPPDFMARPEYLLLLKGRDLSGLEVDLYRKPWMPTVAGFVQWQPSYQGGFGTKDSDGFDKWFYISSAVAGLSVNIPIYDGGGTKAKRERALISAQTVEIQRGMLENAISLELDGARKQFLNAQERVANQEKNLALAQRIYDTTQTKYKAGVGSSFEITQSESGLYTAQQGLLQAQFDLLSAKVAIKKAMGQ
ncbi:MAG: TolC family protein [Saprospiraceae bacterium]|nr:TolC family protein [Lewinellaceae bacterium]MBP6810555.1 TolC family protein [Saprospiraceae bacterium]